MLFSLLDVSHPGLKHLKNEIVVVSLMNRSSTLIKFTSVWSQFKTWSHVSFAMFFTNCLSVLPKGQNTEGFKICLGASWAAPDTKPSDPSGKKKTPEAPPSISLRLDWTWTLQTKTVLKCLCAVETNHTLFPSLCAEWRSCPEHTCTGTALCWSWRLCL